MKKIVIHVGPPKTGSSVLQNWFVNNKNILKENDIYYPPHKISPLGISSGNSKSVLDFDISGKSIFSEVKYFELLNIFFNSNDKYLLLSSEYFFYQLDNFFHTTKNIEKKIGIKIDIVFVVYIRPEFEFVESIYNQSIKRNGNYNSFPRWSILPGKEINRLKNIIASIGPEFFSLRAYGSRNFYKTNIIEDFLSEVDLNFKIEKDYIVNNSYSFESLEFKRWVNKYSGTLFDNELDVVLQSIEWGDKNYSLLPNSLYQSYKTQSLYNIKELNEVCEIHDFNRLSKYIDDSERKPYKHQVLGDKGLKLILDYVYVKDKTLLISIIDYIDKIEESNGDIIKIKIKIFLDGKKRVEVK